ncbi:HAMP domain-containing histidine kinase [Alteromonas sp. K632G]|uniref:sensor histidine kinase n=1 Tax=Alteromonas sp. K632G TaxID=2820757 RepID=UPI001AD7C11F|nr:HAMP domain-containing histidine kinase [Alteromonas sp. K632G]
MRLIKNKLRVAALCATAIGMAPMLYVSDLSVVQKALLVLVSLCLCTLAVKVCTAPINKQLEALKIGLLNFKDGEFSSTLSCKSNDEFKTLSQLYNDTAETLRREKQWLYQRELMLDKVLHSSPDVLLLVNDQMHVVLSNRQACEFFHPTTRVEDTGSEENGAGTNKLGASKLAASSSGTRSLEGYTLGTLLNNKPDTLKDVLLENREGLFTLPQGASGIQTWHMSTGTFLLNNQTHRLYILKQMTRELNRQEVSVWKKVIRVISHELNNSLGPISSLLHSGQIVGQQNGDARLVRVFHTIEERIAHLNQFVQGYGRFAKLPPPVLATIDWDKITAQLSNQCDFKLTMQEAVEVKADAVQLEQLLINLLKNAHESGGDPQDVELVIKQTASQVIIEVLDSGKGMTDSVMTNALVPFYSTKANGSGLGLALCREITDAHNGHLVIQNRKNKGLCVRFIIDKTTK